MWFCKQPRWHQLLLFTCQWWASPGGCCCLSGSSPLAVGATNKQETPLQRQDENPWLFPTPTKHHQSGVSEYRAVDQEAGPGSLQGWILLLNCGPVFYIIHKVFKRSNTDTQVGHLINFFSTVCPTGCSQVPPATELLPATTTTTHSLFNKNRMTTKKQHVYIFPAHCADRQRVTAHNCYVMLQNKSTHNVHGEHGVSVFPQI